MQTQNNIPALRFPEFDGEWKGYKFPKIIIKSNQGVNTTTEKVEYSNSGYIVVRSNNISENNISLEDVKFVDKETFKRIKETCKPKIGDILYCNIGSALGSAALFLSEKDIIINWNVFRIQPNLLIVDNFFLTQDLNRIRKTMRRFATESTMPFISSKAFNLINFNLPSIPEQQKIASFLSAVDEKIQQLTRKAALLEQYKKGIMQQLFSGTLRFKDDDGKDFPEWEEKKLGDFLSHKSKRNKDFKVELVLSVSNKKGFISQNEQFDGYEVASKDLSNYKIVNKDDIAYNPSRINVGSIARLINFEKGIVSPMYVVFSLKNGLDKVYFENLYNTHRFKHLIKVGCSGSVRDSLNFEDLAKFQFQFPSLKEQQKIASFFSGIDVKIESVKAQLEKTQTFKKGLLQQMFV